MDNRMAGEELSQLSRLLFDASANKWYLAIGLEVVAGILATALGLFDLPGDWSLVGAILGVVLLGGAYALRLQFEDTYDVAETMRRQSVLTEALGWSLEPA